MGSSSIDHQGMPWCFQDRLPAARCPGSSVSQCCVSWLPHVPSTAVSGSSPPAWCTKCTKASVFGCICKPSCTRVLQVTTLPRYEVPWLSSEAWCEYFNDAVCVVCGVCGQHPLQYQFQQGKLGIP